MLIVIPARGGSKGVPGKNIKILNGKPLIQYTIEAALEIFNKDEIIVSTDSKEIKKTVEELGVEVPFLRPPELASDSAGSREVLLHAIEFMENKGHFIDTVILLQPTSPFRNAKHIREALSLYTADIDMIVSVKETSSNPYYVLREEDDNGFLKKSKEGHFKTRQECPRVWELNGAIYVININSLKTWNMDEFSKVKKYEMDDITSHDIDTPLDWIMAEVLSVYET